MIIVTRVYTKLTKYYVTTSILFCHKHIIFHIQNFFVTPSLIYILSHSAYCSVKSSVLFCQIKRIVLSHPANCSVASSVLFCHIQRIVLSQPANCFVTSSVLFCHIKRIVLSHPANFSVTSSVLFCHF